jgi:hypothetical protein
MRFRTRRLAVLLVLSVITGGLTLAGDLHPAEAVPNPVATNRATYQAFGRVFPDPQGCLSQDTNGDDVNDIVAPGASPWAKGTCASRSSCSTRSSSTV